MVKGDSTPDGTPDDLCTVQCEGRYQLVEMAKTSEGVNSGGNDGNALLSLVAWLAWLADTAMTF